MLPLFDFRRVGERKWGEVAPLSSRSYRNRFRADAAQALHFIRTMRPTLLIGLFCASACVVGDATSTPSQKIVDAGLSPAFAEAGAIPEPPTSIDWDTQDPPQPDLLTPDAGDAGSTPSTTPDDAAPPAVMDACMTASGRMRLAWDPVADSSVTGYRLYYGTAHATYTSSVDVGLTATPSAPTHLLTGLSCGTNYFVAVTAYNGAMLESDYSTEVNAPPNCSCVDGGA